MFGTTSEKLVIAVLLVAALSATAVSVLVSVRGGDSGFFSSGDAGNQPKPPQLPSMQLQQQFAGPLVGTAIQRWRDPIDGTICYIFLPMVVHHSAAPAGYVQYGANSIGSITCLPGTAQAPGAQQ